MNLPEGIYALPQGVSPENAEKYFQDNLEKARISYRDAIYQLVVYYSVFGKAENCPKYLNQYLEITRDHEERAFIFLAYGQIMEKLRDYPKAAEYYSKAIDEGTSDQRTNYFIHNNLGFSLNTIGKFRAGEEYCRKAITIDSKRYNAYKNLGISLEGQDDFDDAANCYMEATRKSLAMKGSVFDSMAMLIRNMIA
jgi:tetratricopeptide (TPR) repeat protein